MAIPRAAKKFGMSLDPTDRLDFIIAFNSFLQQDEVITNFVLELSDEAIADGIILMTGDGRDPAVLLGTQVKFWLTVNVANRDDEKFNGGGADYGLEITITTNSNPARTLQRTCIVNVQQQ